MFCYNCGQKIMEGAKFCSNCGSNLSVIAGSQSDESEGVDKGVMSGGQRTSDEDCTAPQPNMKMENAEEKIDVAFKKAFGSANKFGNLVYIFGLNPISQELENNMQEFYLSGEPGEKPLLIFDYGNQNLTDGLVVSNQRIVWHFATTGQQEIELSDIKDVSMGKAVLATVMNIISCNNIKYKSIYLTGIQDETEFVVKFRKFVNEVYAIYHGNNEDADEVCIKDDIESNVEFIIRACNSVSIDSMYCEVGHPEVMPTASKYSKAKCNFNIPDDESIFLIYDATIFGGCQKGFAVCTTGFYYCGHQRGYWDWKQFKEVPISSSFTGFKVGYEEFNTATDGKKLLMILRSIQECL